MLGGGVFYLQRIFDKQQRKRNSNSNFWVNHVARNEHNKSVVTRATASFFFIPRN